MGGGCIRHVPLSWLRHFLFPCNNIGAGELGEQKEAGPLFRNPELDLEHWRGRGSCPQGISYILLPDPPVILVVTLESHLKSPNYSALNYKMSHVTIPSLPMPQG